MLQAVSDGLQLLRKVVLALPLRQLVSWSPEATPHMNAGHLLFAAGMSAYMLVGIRHEERAMVGLFGSEYDDYKARVGMLAPRLRSRS